MTDSSPNDPRRANAHRWRGDRWDPVIGRAIEQKLQRRRSRLAQLLDIDPAEEEWQQDPNGIQVVKPGHTSKSDLSYRRPSSKGKVVARIDLAIGELSAELRRCWSLLRDVNRAASLSRVYHNLEQVETDPDNFLISLDSLDPETRAHIEDFHPGGWMAVEEGKVTAQSLAAAARSARLSTPRPRRGRPLGTRDHAGERLARGLADIYYRYRGTKPARRVRPERGGVEYGPFKEFVEEVMSVVPRRLRQTSKGGHKGIDHLVRVGVKHIRSRC